MKKFLIVMPDAILLSVFKSWVFRARKKETVLFARDSQAALQILTTQSIDLLITPLSLSGMDGIELIIAASTTCPELKAAFFLTENFMLQSEKLSKLAHFYFVEQPTSLKEFCCFEQTLDVAEYQAPVLSKINIVDFLKLLMCRKKTCLLMAQNQATEQQALVYFENGVLYEAMCGGFKGVAAMEEILTWKEVRFAFMPLPEDAPFTRNIKVSLSELFEKYTQL